MENRQLSSNIVNTYLSEIERQFSSPLNKIKSVYHYTTEDALYNILKTGEIRFSNIEDMNDPEELNHGWDIIKSYCQNEIKSTTWLNLIQNDFKLNHHVKIYVLSTTDKNDDLQPWGFYSNKC